MEKKTILIVEDEPSIAEVVSLYLKRAEYNVTIASDGEKAMELLEKSIPDLVILDIMLPHVDGFSITRWLRERHTVPIIMLTSRRDESDRIAGLELGADDYVVKPFSPQELVSRVRAVLRRMDMKGELPVSEEPKLEIGDISIDPSSRSVCVREEEISLTVKEFDLLYLFAKNPRHVFSRDQLLERVWGEAKYIDPSTVTVHVRRLREKIETDSSEPIHLLTVWGVGYKFEP
ncbi:MAG: response regulator transcription factor [Anaerolineales bacterium]|jgi:DNA-binding response OmpR family regulator